MARHPILDNVPEPAPRPVRRRWGFTIILLVISVTAYAGMKHCAMGGLAAKGVDEGTRAIASCIAGNDPALCESAERSLVRAASTSVTDRYPAFLIQTNRKIVGVLGGGEGEPIVGAIVEMQWGRARELAATLGEAGSQPRASWEQMIDDLEGHSAASTP